MPKLSRAAWLYMAIVVLAAASMFVYVLLADLDWDITIPDGPDSAGAGHSVPDL